MREFNLEEYLENPNMRVVTRDGRPARIICTDAKIGFPIIALIAEKDGTEAVCSYNARGEYWRNNELTDTDLMFAPTKKEGWVNVYDSQIAGGRYSSYSIFPNESEARHAAENEQTYVATCKIEWEE